MDCGLKISLMKNIYYKLKNLDDNFLINTSIVEFDNNFNLVRVIESKRIDITENNWKIFNPSISKQ